MSEQTLRDYAISRYGTIKQFAKVWGQSTGTVSSLLRGSHQTVLSRKEVERLAELLDISFEECVKATNASFKQYYAHLHSNIDYWELETRWRREDQAEEEVKEWVRSGYQGRNPFTFDPFAHEALAIFGLSRHATEADVLKAFRRRVKAMADGRGGYNGDMDTLTQAKEKALKYVTRSR